MKLMMMTMIMIMITVENVVVDGEGDAVLGGAKLGMLSREEGTKL